MLKRYYAIHDKVAKTFSGLFEQQNDAVASRKTKTVSSA